MASYDRLGVIVKNAREKVLLALDRKRSCEVVMTILNPDCSAEERANYRSQLAIFRTLKSPDMVPFVAHSTKSLTTVSPRLNVDDGGYWKRLQTDDDEFQDFFVRMLEFAKLLHERGTHYGAIDKSHFVFDAEGRPKILLTPTLESVRGSNADPRYSHIPPEQIRRSVVPGPAGDLYRFGMTFMDIKVGPTFGQRVSPTIQRSEDFIAWHATDAELPDELYTEFLPADLRYPIKCMTSKNLEERFATASECLEALRKDPHIQQKKVSPQPAVRRQAVRQLGPSVVQKQIKLPKDRDRKPLMRALTFALAILLVVLCLILSLVINDGRRAQFAEAETTVRDNTTEIPPVDPAAIESADPSSLSEASGTNQSATGTQGSSEALANTRKPTAPLLGTGDVNISIHFNIEKPQAQSPKLTSTDNGMADNTPSQREGERTVRDSAMPTLAWVTKQEANKAREQATVVRLLDELSRGNMRGKPLPYGLPDYPTDPRAAFALALFYYGDCNVEMAHTMCELSLKNAQHFDIPFVTPVRLLNWLQIHNHEHSLAIVQCRKTLNWLRLCKSHDPYSSEAADEMLRWAGLVSGYESIALECRHLPIGESHSLEQALTHWQNHSSWSQFKLANQQVSDRNSELVRRLRESRKQDQEAYDQRLEEDVRNDEMRKEYLPKQIERRVAPGGSMMTMLDDLRFQNIKPRSRFRHSAAFDPKRFDAYYRLEIPSLAQLTLETFKRPTE